jgi:hypothetical protein
MEVYRPDYTITKLAAANVNERSRTKINCRAVVTGFFGIGELVEVIDLYKLERTTQIRILGHGNTAILANSLFTENANKYVVMQEIDQGTAQLISKEAVEWPGSLSGYVVTGENRIILLSVITDEYIESLRKTKQKKLL